MSIFLRRRDFITLLGGAAAGWPLAVGAQRAATPVIGYLHALGQNDRPNLQDAFRRGLRETGYTEGRNVAIEYRFAENQPNRLPALAADLVRRNVALIGATGGSNSILAAKASTAAIPIVFTSGGDPVQAGFVTSLNRPDRNITGVTFFPATLIGKILGFLHDILPHATVIALLQNPKGPFFTARQSDAQRAARTLGVQLLSLNASTPGEIDVALASLRGRAGALVMAADPYFVARRQQIVALAMRDAIPVAGSVPEWTAEGALMSYGNDPMDLYRRAGVYAGRILKGEKPGDLPIDQATRFQLVINLKAAKTLNVAMPPTLLALADEVIE